MNVTMRLTFPAIQMQAVKIQSVGLYVIASKDFMEAEAYVTVSFLIYVYA